MDTLSAFLVGSVSEIVRMYLWTSYMEYCRRKIFSWLETKPSPSLVLFVLLFTFTNALASDLFLRILIHQPLALLFRDKATYELTSDLTRGVILLYWILSMGNKNNKNKKDKKPEKKAQPTFDLRRTRMLGATSYTLPQGDG